MTQVRRILFATAFLCCFTVAQFAQNTGTPRFLAKDVTDKLDSKLMGREMPYRVTFPYTYLGAKDGRYPVLYLLHGLTGHYNNWMDKAKLWMYVDRHGVIIVSAVGENGWYTDSTTKPNSKYESYIIR